ncbi:Leucine-rich repeat and WD repeat-containing protein 1 [Lamellibrachia satsuma]|nr:Leucine-rich repeat and WD repeat-containing protein 1 [Lamellibrachia satsuma]
MCLNGFQPRPGPGPQYVGPGPSRPAKLCRGPARALRAGPGPKAQPTQGTSSPGEDILNMVFSQSSGHLVAGCEEGCYAWKIDQSRNVKKHREPSLELVLPGINNKMVDGLTLVSDDLVASKPAHQGCIFLWTLFSPLVSNRRSTTCAVTTVQPLIVLDWSHTDVEFIIPGARNG